MPMYIFDILAIVNFEVKNDCSLSIIYSSSEVALQRPSTNCSNSKEQQIMRGGTTISNGLKRPLTGDSLSPLFGLYNDYSNRYANIE